MKRQIVDGVDVAGVARVDGDLSESEGCKQRTHRRAGRVPDRLAGRGQGIGAIHREKRLTTAIDDGAADGVLALWVAATQRDAADGED